MQHHMTKADVIARLKATESRNAELESSLADARRELMAERRRTQEELAGLQQAKLEVERSMRTKDEFLANMSHELRTPLNSILMLNESIRDELFGPLTDQQLSALRDLDTKARHLLALINDILDLSKVEAGKLELKLGMVSADAICQASLLFVRELAMKNQIHLVYARPIPDIQLEADGKRLKQMLINLLTNAVKFTLAGGRVQLSVKPEQERQQIRFVVEDTGIGIAAADLPKLFQAFSQLNSGPDSQVDGTGLGLMLVKRLAEQHGGSIEVTSELGRGSCFTVVLPYSVA